MSKLSQLVESLPKGKDAAVKELVAFKFAKSDRVEGYFEKEGETIADDSFEELYQLELKGKLPEGVFAEVSKQKFESAGA